MAAGVILFAGAAIGLSYTKYDELTTTIDLDDGITCTLNGKEVSNGETVTIRQDMGTVRIHLESEYPIPIIMGALWKSSDRTIMASSLDCKGCDVQLGHGDFTGRFIAHYQGDGDLANVVLKFTIGEGITVSAGGTQINDGDEYTFVGDGTITVTTNDGQRHDVKYKGSWSNEYGMSGGASGNELNSTVSISIVDMMYFSDGHGTMEIHI